MMFFIYTKYIMQQYYGNYDKNIISTRGGGKVTQNKSCNKTKRLGVISSKFKNDVNYMPPLSKITNRSNKIKTNARVNPNNYVEEDDDSNNYYYTSQQINDVNIINTQDANSSIGRILNMENPIKSPPTLVTTEPNPEGDNEKIIKEKMKEKIKRQVLERIQAEIRKNEIKKNIEIENKIKRDIMNKEKEESLKKIADDVGKNSWISENRLYTIRSTQNSDLPWKDKEYIVNLNKNNDSRVIENYENTKNTENNNIKNTEIDYSLILFCAVIFTIIIMYFVMKR